MNEDKVEFFKKICKEELEKIIILNNTISSKNSEPTESYNKVINEFGEHLKAILNNQIEEFEDTIVGINNYESSKEIDTNVKNFDIIPILFHEFLLYYFNNLNKNYDFLNKVDFDWIYDKFKFVNIHSRDFYIEEITVKMLKEKLENNEINPVWLDSKMLKENYRQLRNKHDYKNLRSLILLVNYLIKRKIETIKL